MLMEPAATVEIGQAKVPWYYSDPVAEHRALRTETAVLDLNGTGLISLPPRAATELLRQVLPYTVELLHPGSSASTLLLDDNGHPADLLTIYRLRSLTLIETAPGRGQATLAALRALPGGDACTDVRGAYDTVALEGPHAWRAVRELIGDGITALPLGGVTERTWNDLPVIVARVNLSGEYGYRITVPAGRGAALFEAATAYAVPVGWDALETAMLEVRQPVLHRECGSGDTVVECGYNWLVDIEDRRFTGRDALLAQIQSGPTTRTVGLALDPAAVLPDEAPVLVAGLVVGRVIWHVSAPDRILALARLAPEWAAAGIDVEIGTLDGPVPARTLSAPYVSPRSWSIPIE
jgi:glycine cleavage system aminomethyltransferase T